MAKKIFSKHLNNNVKLFLFFFVLASVFWVLTKFGKDFTAPLTVRINYEEIPNSIALAEENRHSLSFDLTANGFEILYYKLKKPKLTIPVEAYYEEGKHSISIPRNEILRLLNLKFNKYLEIKNLSVDELEIKLEAILTKRIPVFARTELGFKKGYKENSPIQLNPDSVLISGPEETLAGIDSIGTEKLKIKDIDKTFSQKVKLLDPEKKSLKIDPAETSLTVSVAEFSQGQFALPVEVINLPPGVELKLVPQRVTVTYDVEVEKFALISEQDFKVIADYADRNDENSTLELKLVRKPDTDVVISLDPKQVQFFIFK